MSFKGELALERLSHTIDGIGLPVTSFGIFWTVYEHVLESEVKKCMEDFEEAVHEYLLLSGKLSGENATKRLMDIRMLQNGMEEEMRILASFQKSSPNIDRNDQVLCFGLLRTSTKIDLFMAGRDLEYQSN